MTNASNDERFGGEWFHSQQEERQDPQPGAPAVPPVPAKSGCLSTCGCGCLVIVLLAVVLALTAYWMARQVLRMEPEQANALLQEVLPSKLPEGYSAYVGLDMKRWFGFRAVMIAPSGLRDDDKEVPRPGERSMLMMVVASEGANEVEINQLVEDHWRDVAPGGKDAAEVRTTEVKLRVGKKEVAGQRIDYKMKGEGNGKVEEAVQYRVPVRPGVIVVAVGSKEEFDMAAFEAFLQSIRNE